MSFGQDMSKASAVYYRYDDKPAPTGWRYRRVGWFGKIITLCLVGGLFACTLTTRAALLQTINAHYAHSVMTEMAERDSKLAQLTTVVAPSLAPNIVQLQPVLDKWAETHKGQKWGVVVRSLEGPQFEASLNPDASFQTASVYKLLLTYPLMQQVPLDQQKKIKLTVGDSTKTLEQCVDLMLRVSDNACGNAVGDYLNWKKATDTLVKAGYRHTDLTNRSGMLVTSPSDVALFLERLNDDMMPSANRDKLLGIMNKQIYRKGIPMGCPGCQVYDKIGDIDNVLHDAAIVSYSRGRYVLAIFSQDVRSYPEIAKLTGQIQQKILDTVKK